MRLLSQFLIIFFCLSTSVFAKKSLSTNAKSTSKTPLTTMANGNSVMDPQAAADLEDFLKKHQDVEIEILRGQSKIKNTYHIK